MWLVAICDSISLLCVCIGGTHMVPSFLLGNNLVFLRIMVVRTCLSWFLNICIHCVPDTLIYIVLWFLLGECLFISRCTHICPLVSPGSFFMSQQRNCASFVDMVMLKSSFYVVVSVVLVSTPPENWWGCLLPQVLLYVVNPSRVCNYKLFDHVLHIFFWLLVLCHFPGGGGGGCRCLLLCLIILLLGVPIFWKKCFTHLFLCFFFLIGCMYYIYFSVLLSIL